MKRTAITKSSTTFFLSSPVYCLFGEGDEEPSSGEDYRDDEDEVVEALQREPARRGRRGAVDGRSQGRLVEEGHLHYQLEHLGGPAGHGDGHGGVREDARPPGAARLVRGGHPVGVPVDDRLAEVRVDLRVVDRLTGSGSGSSSGWG